jgi:hypothetical protein
VRCVYCYRNANARSRSVSRRMDVLGWTYDECGELAAPGNGLTPHVHRSSNTVRGSAVSRAPCPSRVANPVDHRKVRPKSLRCLSLGPARAVQGIDPRNNVSEADLPAGTGCAPFCARIGGEVVSPGWHRVRRTHPEGQPATLRSNRSPRRRPFGVDASPRRRGVPFWTARAAPREGPQSPAVGHDSTLHEGGFARVRLLFRPR